MLHPFLGRDVPWLIKMRSISTPDSPFLIWESFVGEDAQWTFRDFHAVVETVAANLSATGVSVGERVLVHLDNCPEFLFVWFACARLGATVVTTNTRCPEDEVAYFIRHSRVRLAVTQPKYMHMVRALMPPAALVYLRRGDPGVMCSQVTFDADKEFRPFGDLLEEAGALPDRPADPELPVSVQYTSGTTSRPKGVVWTHANALWAGKVNAAHAQIGVGDSNPVFLPLFHTNAIGYSTLATLWSGGTIVLQPKYSASRFWDIAVRHRCTWANMIGFTIQALVKEQAPAKHSFRFWACASDVKIIRDLWGIKTIGWWGMTETVSHGIVADHAWLNPEMSMGRPAPEYQLRVLADDGTPVSPGETGKLHIKGVRGLSLFLEYLNDPNATAAAFTADGWMDTGDLVTLAEGGDLFFAEREKDMLKIGGENVAASEIERVLLTMPGVAEAAVVGKPDAMLDEVAVAFVVPAPNVRLHSEAVIAHCARHLADFKTPRHVRFLRELPKGTLDKVLKKDLRALLQ